MSCLKDDVPHGPEGGKACFTTTRWSVVLAARGDDSKTAFAALSELCGVYWYPLYAYVRRRGHSPEEAEDLTQSFFTTFLAKNYLDDLKPDMGRFRSFLLTSLKHFLANKWDAANAQKRGGGEAVLSLDDAERRYQDEPRDHVTPETLFERRWALTLLEQVLARLRTEFVTTEKAELFDHLKVFLSDGESGVSYAEIAECSGLKEGTVKVAVHRLRRRYGELLRSEISQTIGDPREVEDEVRNLIAALSNR